MPGTHPIRRGPPRCRCRGACRRPGRSPARRPPGVPPPTSPRAAPRRRRSPPANSADAVARPGSRRRAIGNGRPRPSCSRTSAVASDARSSATIEPRTATDSAGMSPPTRTTVGERATASPPSSPASGPSNATASWTSVTSVGRAGFAPGAATTMISVAIGRTASMAWWTSGRPSTGSASLSRPNLRDRPPARTMTLIPSVVIRPAGRRSGTGHVPRVRPAQDPSAVEVGEDGHDVLAAGARRVAEGRRGQRCARRHRQRLGLQRPIGRARIGQVRLEDEDPARPVERADAVGRAAGGVRGLAERRWRCHRERPLEPVHRRRQGRVRLAGPPVRSPAAERRGRRG